MRWQNTDTARNRMMLRYYALMLCCYPSTLVHDGVMLQCYITCLYQPLHNIQSTYGERVVLQVTVFRWYEASEKGCTCVSLKGGPSALCWATMEVLQNTCTALLVYNLSITLHKLKRAVQCRTS